MGAIKLWNINIHKQRRQHNSMQPNNHFAPGPNKANNTGVCVCVCVAVRRVLTMVCAESLVGERWKVGSQTPGSVQSHYGTGPDENGSS